MTQPETVTALLAEFEGASADDVLADAARRFGGRVAFASSLGLEDQVLTAMIAEAGLDIPIFTLDTGRLYPETYDLIDRTSKRYGVTLHSYFPAAVAVDHLLDLAGGGEVRVQRDAVALAGAVDQVVGLGVEAPCVEREDRDVELGLGDHRCKHLVLETQGRGEGDAAGEAPRRVGEHVFGAGALELGEQGGHGLRLRHGVTSGLVGSVSMQITKRTNNRIAYYDEAGGDCKPTLE